MKKQRKSRYCNQKSFEEFPYTDTRYYGVWASGKGRDLKVKIDPRRFQESTYTKFTDDQLLVINKRKSHYFHPKKPQYYSYHCNVFCDTIKEINDKWTKHFQPLISSAIERIQKPRKLTPGDCDLLMCGILEPDEANMWANYNNMMNDMKYKDECIDVIVSLYAQFLHLLASQIEAVTVKILTEEKAVTDRFDRNSLYGTAVGKEITVEQLPSFKYYDKLYCIWHFIKHNSFSTYEKLKEKYPETLHKAEYQQGNLAIHYLNVSDELISELMNGCTEFFKEYCQLVFEENYAEAQWNYGQYFLSQVSDTIESFVNPLGLPSYI